MTATREYFDIVVIVPLEEELVEFLELFPSVQDRSSQTELIHIVNSGNDEIKMLVAHQVEMGRKAAEAITDTVLNSYDVGLVVCLGIAGGLSDDLKLCDVCYSGKIIDVYENSKITDSEGGGQRTELSPIYFETPIQFWCALNFVRTQPSLRPAYEQWRKDRAEAAAALLPETIAVKPGISEHLREPRTLNGAIACGAVSKSTDYNDRLKAIERKVLAIETESGGVFSKAREHNIPAITIRGISDYADREKGNIEVQSGGSIRKLAAANAASFLGLQLTNDRFLQALKDRRQGSQGELGLKQPASALDRLASIIKQLAEDIDDSLGKLSPEYRLQPKGYTLPLPRVRICDQPDATQQEPITEPLEVFDAIALHDRLILRVPRTYPDEGLVWILADDMLTREIDGKQLIPIVVDGNAIKGNNRDFKKAAPFDYDEADGLEGSQLVFIVENIPFESRHRISLIIDEAERLPHAKFVFVERGDVNLTASFDFQTHTAAVAFDVCPISFLQIALFIKKNFSLEHAEAEVVALRLRDTFDRFHLDAHPTYFAGISKEMLVALLQANRRSELIQIAVDGFLTFLVAGDRQDVSLSRSTRARFLRKLVVAMKVEGQSFDQAGLIDYTRQFAERHDFDIDPIAFIQSFVDEGILHFDLGAPRLSLPFMESYLLAVELASDPENAEKYFCLDEGHFDISAFDIYSEIGPASTIVETVIKRLEAARAMVGPQQGEQHILLSDLAPAALRRPEKAASLKRRLKQAMDSLKESSNLSHEKQQLLDLGEKLRGEVAKSSKKTTLATVNTELTEDQLNLADAVKVWSAATVLLGSGAEHLDAQTKRRLGTLIIDVASRLIHDWTALHLTIDFGRLKAALTDDEFVSALPGDQDIEQKRVMADTFFDLLEYATIADPLRRVIGHLCEQARLKVLATSIEKATPSGLVESIIHGTWLADIDSERGMRALRRSIKELPTARFFRVTLASHYLSRVYWNHWQSQDRMVLLDATEDVLKPLNVEIDKPKLKRLVERADADRLANRKQTGKRRRRRQRKKR